MLFVTTAYPTAENPYHCLFVREHARAARSHGDVEVSVLHLAGLRNGQAGFERETSEELTAGIPTYRARYRASPIPKTSYAAFVWSVYQAVRSIRRDGFAPDILHASFFDAALPAVLVAKLSRMPCVVSEHLTDFPRRSLTRRQLGAARLAFRLADVVMPVSHDLHRQIESHGIRADFSVIPNAVDCDLFHPPHSGEREVARILFVGHLEQTHRKGVPTLLDALAGLDVQQTDWSIDLIGDGDARTEYERQAAKLGLTDRVRFIGNQPKARVAELMRRASLFVLPSRFENLPCVILEAICCGTPVVATPIGGVPEIIDDSRGILVPPEDPRALGEAVATVLGGRVLDGVTPNAYDSEQISAWGRQRFSLDAVGAELHQIYERCLR